MKYTIPVLVLLGPVKLAACEACKLQQPKITQGITHGAGPGSGWDWFIVGVVALITLLTLFYSVKYLARPGEKDMDHIKYRIFMN